MSLRDKIEDGFYVGGMGFLNEKSRRNMLRITDDYFSYQYMKDHPPYGPASYPIKRLIELFELPIETGLDPECGKLLSVPVEFIKDSSDYALLGSIMRPMLQEMLADEEDILALDELWQRLENLKKNAACDKTSFHPDDLKILLFMLCQDIQLEAVDDEDLDRFISYMFAGFPKENVADAPDPKLFENLMEFRSLTLDLLSFRPLHGYTDTYAKVMVQSTMINAECIEEARLMLNDRDLQIKVHEDYCKENPDDRWAEHMYERMTAWPAPRKDGKKMRLMDSAHHYALEDYKESGRTSGGSQSLMMDMLTMPKDPQKKRALQRA